MQIEIQDKALVAIGKTGKVFNVAVGDFNASVLQYIFTYGLKQVLNDAVTSGKTDAEKVGLANKKMDALLAGEIRLSRESDPVGQRARQIAIKLVSQKFKKEGLDPTAKDGKFSEACLALAAQDKVRAMAEAQLKAEAELGELEF